MPGPGTPVGDDLAALFDRLAALTREPDGNLTALRRLYEDERLRVPATVDNAILGRDEPLWPGCDALALDWPPPGTARPDGQRG